MCVYKNNYDFFTVNPSLARADRNMPMGTPTTSTSFNLLGIPHSPNDLMAGSANMVASCWSPVFVGAGFLRTAR